MNDSLAAQVKRLPDNPGIYKYFDQNGRLLYIGKAKNLKKRVSSYFNKVHDQHKTNILVSRIHSLQFTIVDTETDALLLENALIKEYQPRYNISLKDDKTYPYLAIKKEPFPRIITTRKKLNDGSEYFGPYTSGNMLYIINDLIRNLFYVRTCQLNLQEASIKNGKFRTCLEHDIGHCLAPCVGLQSKEAYDEMIQQIRGILKGKLQGVRQFLLELMKEASENLAFEKAESYKQKLFALDSYQSRSTIVNDIKNDVDVFSFISDEKSAYINYLGLSNGIIIHTKSFEIQKKMDESDAEILNYVITNVRQDIHSNATEIIIPFQPEWDIKDIQYTIPKSGEKKKLLDLSLKNALFFKRDKLKMMDNIDPSARIERILNQMQKDLRLTQLPKHIECFDNSNLQGTNPVSACVVFKDAKPSKKDYRHFIPRSVEGPDDFATMREIIYRRYKRMLDENTELPNLIIIDGGKGQLSSAVESLKALNIYGKVPILGIAKRLEELFYPEDELPLFIDKKSETLKIIQQLRDEAHRFGITHHRKRRMKSTIQSNLKNIPGVGDETTKKLLQIFKSVKKIKEASLAELNLAIGSSKAQFVWNYFHHSQE